MWTAPPRWAPSVPPHHHHPEHLGALQVPPSGTILSEAVHTMWAGAKEGWCLQAQLRVRRRLVLPPSSPGPSLPLSTGDLSSLMNRLPIPLSSCP